MASSVNFDIPVHSSWVPRCFERIIDKKVRGVALNCLEKFVDWLATCLYRPYSNLYRDKLERIHFFSDGLAKLYDLTKEGIAGIRNQPIFPQPGAFEFDFITLKGVRVFFNRVINHVTAFAREQFTDYVVVRDGPAPDQVVIHEQETARHVQVPPAVNEWTVDLNEVHLDLRVEVGEEGNIVRHNESSYLAEALPPAVEEEVV